MLRRRVKLVGAKDINVLSLKRDIFEDFRFVLVLIQQNKKFIKIKDRRSMLTANVIEKTLLKILYY